MAYIVGPTFYEKLAQVVSQQEKMEVINKKVDEIVRLHNITASYSLLTGRSHSLFGAFGRSRSFIERMFQQRIVYHQIITELARMDEGDRGESKEKDPELSARHFDLYEEQEKKSSRIILIDESQKIKTMIGQIYRDHTELYRLTSRNFEELIAGLFMDKGFKVELTKQTRDQGFDILALKNENGFPSKWLVECKRYGEDKPVGIGVIRSFCDVIAEQRANQGIIVTTSYFSLDARKREKENIYLLNLADRADILAWVAASFER